jgi:hypothetical protein
MKPRNPLEEYGKQKGADKKRPLKTWSLVALVTAITAVVTFAVTLLGAYTTYMQQTDDGKVLTGNNGLLFLDIPTQTYHFAPDTLVFSNAGNRPYVVLGVSLSYAKGTVADLQVSPTVCPRVSGGIFTSDTQLVVNAGAVVPFTPQFATSDNKPFENETIDVSLPPSTPPQPQAQPQRLIFLSCLTIRYSIPDSSEVNAFPIMSMELGSPAPGSDQAVNWMPAIAAARARSSSAKILIDRTRTPLSWVNDLMHSVAAKMRKI